MIKFSSIIDGITFEKIKNGTKTVKFYLCDDKRSGLSVNDNFFLFNRENEKLNILVKDIQTSTNLKLLIEKFSLKELGEPDYNTAYYNVKQWFSDSDIKKYSMMAISMEILYE